MTFFNITRRRLLRAMPIFAASATVPAVASAKQHPPEERLRAATVELKAAVEALYPGVEWIENRRDPGDEPMMYLLFARGRSL